MILFLLVFILTIFFSDHLKLCFLLQLQTDIFIVVKNYNTTYSKFLNLGWIYLYKHNLHMYTYHKYTFHGYKEYL